MNKARRARITAFVDRLREVSLELEVIREEEQDAYDSLPDSLQESPNGQASGEAAEFLEDAITGLDTAIDELESIA
jgi:hypothetical protein